MLPKVKKCVVCGRMIAMEETTDYYRYIRLKYCPSCAKNIHRMQNANRMSLKRHEARTRIKLCGEINTELVTENDLLRAQLIRLREENRKLREATDTKNRRN